MTRSLLDLSDRTALEPLARLIRAVREVAGDMPLLLIGAAARDLLLVHAHGVEAQRATEDTDLALAVPTWDTFLKLRKGLMDSGTFTPEGPPHRLRFAEQCVDFIPFGGVERADRSIVWPAASGEVMSVEGLAEALATAVPVRLPRDVSIDVASLPALALLKVWAWADRKYTAPGRDASDLWMLLRHYGEAGNYDRLYGEEGEAALVRFGHDLDLAGAWLLGKGARDVLSRGPDLETSLEHLGAILGPETDPDGPLRLVAQMPPGDRDRQLSLLAAFSSGLFGTRLPET